ESRRGFGACRPCPRRRRVGSPCSDDGSRTGTFSVAWALAVQPRSRRDLQPTLADIVSRYDLPTIWAARVAFFQGWANWSDAADESSLAKIRRGIAIVREQRHFFHLPRLEAPLAEAEASAGEIDAGLRRLDEALAELAHTEQHWYQAEMHRIHAE